MVARIFREGLGIGQFIHEAQFRPKNQPIVVAQVIDKLILLIMGEPHARRAHFGDQLKILFLFGSTDGPALVDAILVAADTM